MCDWPCLISATFLWEGCYCVWERDGDWMSVMHYGLVNASNRTLAVSALTSVVPVLWDWMKQERWAWPKSQTSTRWSSKKAPRMQPFKRMMMIYLGHQALESTRPPASPSAGRSRRKTCSLRSNRMLGCPKRFWCYTPEKLATGSLERSFSGWSSHAPWLWLPWPLRSWRCRLDAWAGGSWLRFIRFILDHSKIQMLMVLETSKVIFDHLVIYIYFFMLQYLIIF